MLKMEEENEQPLLKIEGLYKTYVSGLIKTTENHAVKDCNFHINKGEVISLVGESGSGKSTIANMILRLIKPTAGNLWFNGVNIQDIPINDYYLDVQEVFQDPFSSFNYFYKVDRVLDAAIKFKYGKIPEHKSREKIDEVLDLVGINAREILGRYPHQLSGGQLQRFLLARTLIIECKLLIADEPTSMIDACARADVLNLIKQLREEIGYTVLFITHDIGQAQYVSDRVLVMEQGIIVEQGSPFNVFTNPTHPYTKSLLESVPSLYRKWQL